MDVRDLARDCPIRCRPLQSESDWWRVRELLLATFGRTPPGWNWNLRRWDGWRFHNEQPVPVNDFAARFAIWETAAGRLVAAVHPENGGEAYIELDPDFRAIEPELVAWALEHLTTTDGNGRRLDMWVDEADTVRQRVLADLGFERMGSGGYLRLRRFGGPIEATESIEAAESIEPYVIRSTTPADCEGIAGLLNAAFRRSIHTAVEYRTFIERSPSFEHRLNLVAAAPDGTIAAHVGFTYDAVNRHATVEPVCTHPDHRRRGLSRALLFHGCALVAGRGAEAASLDTGDDPGTNAFYAACGFTEAGHSRLWRHRT